MINAKLILLDQIAKGLRKLMSERPRSNTPLECIEVKLWDGENCVLTCNVPTAIGYLANDIYWDEETNWSNATTATVETI